MTSSYMNQVVLLFVVIASIAVLSDRSEACRCAPAPLCERTSEADVVARVIVKSEKKGGDEQGFFDIIYEVESITWFKTDEHVDEYDPTFEVVTTQSTASCGMKLDVASEYLLILYRTDSGLWAQSCSQSQLWTRTAFDAAVIEVLENQGECISPCSDEGQLECGDFQECRLTSGDDQEEYCADVCSDAACPAFQTCALHQEVECLIEPCPPVRKCCQVGCPEIFHPVCGTNGITYDNDCLLEEAQCVSGGGFSKAYDGECGSPFCSEACPRILRPVCGSDGVTYNNDCLLEVAACQNPQLGITQVSKGECHPTRS